MPGRLLPAGGAALALSLAACAGQDTPRARCIANALAQPGLHNGVAIYNDEDGTAHSVAANWRGRFRLAMHHDYHVASLTKPLVAHAIAQRIAAGEFDLDTPIERLLGQELAFDPETGRTTVRHLLQHTGRIGHPDDLDPLWTRGSGTPSTPDCRAAAAYVAGLPPETKLGGQTFYSNAGYCLLGELLLRTPTETSEPVVLPAILRQPFGAAGGWHAPLPGVHAALKATLPLILLPPSSAPLPDGSWYSYGWRWWPEPRMMGTHWTHTGRLPGLLAVALTDGTDKLLIAHFDGDPPDFQAAAAAFGEEAWQCVSYDDRDGGVEE